MSLNGLGNKERKYHQTPCLTSCHPYYVEMPNATGGIKMNKFSLVCLAVVLRKKKKCHIDHLEYKTGPKQSSFYS